LSPESISLRHVIFAALIYAAFVLEATGIGGDPRGVEPRWLWLAAASAVWLLPLPSAVLWSGLCGLLADALGTGPLGAGLAAGGALAWMLGSLKQARRWRTAIPFLLTTFALAAGGVAAMQGLSSLLTDAAAPDLQRLALLAGGQGAMTALWGAGLGAVYRISRAALRRLLPPLDWRRSHA